MAALDDLVGALVFFTVVAIVSANLSTEGLSIFMVLFLVSVSYTHLDVYKRQLWSRWRTR